MVRRTDRVELRQFVVFVGVDFLLNQARVVILADQFRHSLGLEEGQHIGELVVHRTGGELLRIAQERSETQKIFPLNILKKAFVAGLPEITEGDAISSPCFLLSGELNFLKEPVYCRPNSKTGVVVDGVRNHETCRARIQLSLFSNAAVVGGSRVIADGHASAFSIFVPVEAVGAFLMLFLPVIHITQSGLDAAVGADEDRAVAFAFRGVDTLGDIHLHGKTPGKVVSLLVSPPRHSVKLIEREGVRWSGRRDSNLPSAGLDCWVTGLHFLGPKDAQTLSIGVVDFVP